jgi:hypothetical protein
VLTLRILFPSFVSLVLLVWFLSIPHTTLFLNIVHAQTIAEEASTKAESLYIHNMTTFSAIGQISSLVITVREPGFNITDAFKVILTGDWNLNVNNGSMTNFIVNFLASPMDGSSPHSHQITNFNPYLNEQPITLLNSKDLSVNGTADIKINGRIIWDNAHISVSIYNGNTFSIDPDDNDTENHFGNQQVYGIVTRLF